MTTLNLINEANSDLRVKAPVFPDGQPHLKLDVASLAGIDRTAPLRILSRMASANNLLLILFAKSALDYPEFAHAELHLPYLLGADNVFSMVFGTADMAFSRTERPKSVHILSNSASKLKKSTSLPSALSSL